MAQAIWGRDGGGPRLFLDGRPVYTGSPVEIVRRDRSDLARVEFERIYGGGHRAVLYIGGERSSEDPLERNPRWPES